MATKKATKKGAGKGAKKRGAAPKGAAKKASKKSTKKAGAEKAIVGKCGFWQAVQQGLPSAPSPLLIVVGRCTFPTSGYKVTLKDAVPQGINPRILILKKTVHPPKGRVLPVKTVVPVRYEKKNATIKYIEVIIQPDGAKRKVDKKLYKTT